MTVCIDYSNYSIFNNLPYCPEYLKLACILNLHLGLTQSYHTGLDGNILYSADFFCAVPVSGLWTDGLLLTAATSPPAMSMLQTAIPMQWVTLALGTWHLQHIHKLTLIWHENANSQQTSASRNGSVLQLIFVLLFLLCSSLLCRPSWAWLFCTACLTTAGRGSQPGCMVWACVPSFWSPLCFISSHGRGATWGEEKHSNKP